MKHISLITILTVMVMGQAAAGPKVERAKHIGMVAFHCAEVAGGYYLWKTGWPEKDAWKGKAKVTASVLLVLKGLRDLKNDLHKHMFHHLESWYNYKKQKEAAQAA